MSSQMKKSDSFIFTDYIINVKTSDRFGAGTDAKVFIQLFGEKANSEPMYLKHSTKANKFERNQLDQFTFAKEICLGNLKSIKIWHDNSGIGPSWHLEFVEISDTTSGLKFRFPCHRWLSTDEDGGLTSRELKCLEVTEGPKHTVQKANGVPKKNSDPAISTANFDPIERYTPLSRSRDNIVVPVQSVEVHSAKVPVPGSIYGPYHGKSSPLPAHRKHSAGETKSPYGKYSNHSAHLSEAERRSSSHQLNVNIN